MEALAPPTLPRDRYAGILSGYFLPDAVVATKPASKTDPWSEGGERSILHDCWLLRPEDADHRRSKHPVVCFDVVVDVDGLTMADPRALHDNLTKKLVLVSAMSTGVRRGKFSVRGAQRVLRSLDWVMRWRWSLGIGRFYDLDRSHFDDFVERLKDGDGVLSVVPIHDRLDRLADEVASGAFAIPTTSRRGTLDWDALARKLGVGVSALVSSAEIRAELADRLPGVQRLLLGGDEGIRPGGEDASEGGESDGILSAGAAYGQLQPWDLLSRLSDRGVLEHDPLRFAPFASRSLRSLAHEIGVTGRRTATLDPSDLFRLMDAAATWVLDYAPHVMRALEAYRREPAFTDRTITQAARKRLSVGLDAALPPGMPRLWLSWWTGHEKSEDAEIRGRLAVGEAVKHLMTACAVLIGAFGARRVGEITSLKTGCVVEEKPGLVELTIYIEKTLRAVDRIPVPALIKRVVGVLEELTDGTRAMTNKDWLFEVARSFSRDSKNRMVHFVLDGKAMNSFAEASALAPPAGCGRWDLKPHQLRRGFAVFYYHGFQGASLDALSRFLRHFDPEMTRVYVNEAVAGAIGELREEIEARSKASRAAATAEDRKWLRDAKALLDDLAARPAAWNEVRCEALVQRLLGMWAGTETPIGRGAARLHGDLKTMVADAEAQVRIGARSNSPDAVRAPLTRLLRHYAESHYLEPVPGHAAHCSCRPGHADDLERAECLKEKAAGRAPWASPPAGGDTRPDYAFSNAYVCLTCDHCVATCENQRVIAKAVEQVGAATERGASPAAREAAAEKFARFKAAVSAASAATQTRK